MSAKTEPILLDMIAMPPGPNCPVCSASLSWMGAGRYVCDICESAHAQGKTIEEVRAEVEDLAHSFGAFMSGNRPHFFIEDTKTGERVGHVHMDPEGDPPKMPWGPINEELRAWQDANAARAAELAEGP